MTAPHDIDITVVAGGIEVDEALKLVGDKLKVVNTDAVDRRDYLTATLTRFRLDLANGEKEHVLLRSFR